MSREGAECDCTVTCDVKRLLCRLGCGIWSVAGLPRLDPPQLATPRLASHHTLLQSNSTSTRLGLLATFMVGMRCEEGVHVVGAGGWERLAAQGGAGGFGAASVTQCSGGGPADSA